MRRGSFFQEEGEGKAFFEKGKGGASLAQCAGKMEAEQLRRRHEELREQLQALYKGNAKEGEGKPPPGTCSTEELLQRMQACLDQMHGGQEQFKARWAELTAVTPASRQYMTELALLFREKRLILETLAVKYNDFPDEWLSPQTLVLEK